MPFYLRKSKKLFGPLRINFSKSGVGASVGVKGARVAIGPKGTRVNMGRNGVYYRKSLSTPASSKRSEPNVQAGTAPIPDKSGNVIQTADIEELIDSSSEAVLADLNTTRGNWLRRLLRLTRPIPVHFELDPDALETFGGLQTAIQSLAQSKTVWLEERLEKSDPKYHAGAGTLVTRRPIRVGRIAPPRIATNVEIFGIDTGVQQLLFFPDRLLVHQRGKYGAIAYAELKVAPGESQFRESGSVPTDAEVVGRSWQYVNKSGGPDKRFKNNRQIPVLRYGKVYLTSPTGLNISLEVSNRVAAEKCCSQMLSAINGSPPAVRA